MPQLSPLNWIFLFFLFWFAILSVFAMIWWSSKVEYSAGTDELTPAADDEEENQWSW